MQMTGNTILITGGGSGIGRGLAEAFHAEGNQVIIAGRRKELLEEVAAANPGMCAVVFDIEHNEAIQSFAEQLKRDYPALNVVIHNAGISRMENVKSGEAADAGAIVAINLLGPIRLTAALLPTLEKQPRAAILTVTSGLAFLPLAIAPTYCATKAALHSYTESLRYQLRGTAVQVIELPPPYVQTELGGPAQAKDPNAMPLHEYIAETMSLLKASPEADEILVERVKQLRFAEANGGYHALFTQFNDHMTKALSR